METACGIDENPVYSAGWYALIRQIFQFQRAPEDYHNQRSELEEGKL
jgi:hypothetical protein